MINNYKTFLVRNTLKLFTHKEYRYIDIECNSSPLIRNI